MKISNIQSLTAGLMIVCMLGVQTEMKAQGDDLEFDYSFEFRTVKNPDFSRVLEVSFYGESDRDKYPVVGAKVNFINLSLDQELSLGSAVTDQEGIATLLLGSGDSLKKDEEGYISFSARFSGTDGIDSFEEQLEVKDARLVMELVEQEGVKTVKITMNEINEEEQLVPVEETDIYFYVQGMVSKLPIYDDWLEEGEYSFEFPEDLPGDQEGNLTIYAMIEDSDDYGRIIQKASAKWGTGFPLDDGKDRSLWSESAPLWMVFILTIVLALVWANILYTIRNLIQINKSE